MMMTEAAHRLLLCGLHGIRCLTSLFFLLFHDRWEDVPILQETQEHFSLLGGVCFGVLQGHPEASRQVVVLDRVERGVRAQRVRHVLVPHLPVFLDAAYSLIKLLTELECLL